MRNSDFVEVQALLCSRTVRSEPGGFPGIGTVVGFDERTRHEN
jgi:hypothetical protein